MQYLKQKLAEIYSNLWVKLTLAIPACFFQLNQREELMIAALLPIIVIDMILGAMLAIYNKCFSWGALSKKFSAKFLLYFFALLASFILSKAYSFVDWWFYLVGSLLVFSEFGSLMDKACQMGLPVPNYYVHFLNEKLNQILKVIIGKNDNSNDVRLARPPRRQKSDKDSF